MEAQVKRLQARWVAPSVDWPPGHLPASVYTTLGQVANMCENVKICVYILPVNAIAMLESLWITSRTSKLEGFELWSVFGIICICYAFFSFHEKNPCHQKQMIQGNEFLPEIS